MISPYAVSSFRPVAMPEYEVVKNVRKKENMLGVEPAFFMDEL